ncbi:hypothetical protein R3P38DRAFT_3123131, partial [Favolaschia claudopus]
MCGSFDKGWDVEVGIGMGGVFVVMLVEAGKLVPGLAGEGGFVIAFVDGKGIADELLVFLDEGVADGEIDVDVGAFFGVEADEADAAAEAEGEEDEEREIAVGTGFRRGARGVVVVVAGVVVLGTLLATVIAPFPDTSFSFPAAPLSLNPGDEGDVDPVPVPFSIALSLNQSRSRRSKKGQKIQKKTWIRARGKDPAARPTLDAVGLAYPALPLVLRKLLFELTFRGRGAGVNEVEKLEVALLVGGGSSSSQTGAGDLADVDAVREAEEVIEVVRILADVDVDAATDTREVADVVLVLGDVDAPDAADAAELVEIVRDRGTLRLELEAVEVRLGLVDAEVGEDLSFKEGGEVDVDGEGIFDCADDVAREAAAEDELVDIVRDLGGLEARYGRDEVDAVEERRVRGDVGGEEGEEVEVDEDVVIGAGGGSFDDVLTLVLVGVFALLEDEALAEEDVDTEDEVTVLDDDAAASTIFATMPFLGYAGVADEETVRVFDVGPAVVLVVRTLDPDPAAVPLTAEALREDAVAVAPPKLDPLALGIIAPGGGRNDERGGGGSGAGGIFSLYSPAC